MLLISVSSLVAFIVASMAIESTPGPNMTYLAVISASKGRHVGFAAVAGVSLGLLMIGLAAALGVSVLVTETVWAYETIRWVGIVYLLWLAYDGWKEAEGSPVPEAEDHHLFLYFRRGLITNLLNPKAAMFYLTVLPGFANPSYAVTGQVIGLTIIYVVVATVIHIAIVSLAGYARPLMDNDRYGLILRRTLAVLLAMVAVWFAVKTMR